MNKFPDLKLKYKILFTMLPLLLGLVLIISTSCGIYFTSANEKDIEKSQNVWFTIVQQRLEHIISRIEDGLIKELSSAKLSAISQKLLSPEYSKLTIQNDLQEIIERINHVDYLIDDAYIIDNSSNLYISYSSSVADRNSPLINYSDFASESGITIHHCALSPLDKDKPVIPVSIPLKTLNPSSSYLIISNEPDPELVLVILINSDVLMNELNSVNSEYFVAHSSLSFKGDDLNGEINSDDKNQLSYKTSIPGLELSISFDRTLADSKKSGIICFIIILSAAIIAIGLILILYLSDFLTRPFRKLSRMINKIKDNTYNLDEKAEYNDETGELIESINSMYVTIKDQIEQITSEEKEKYQYMEQVLTEQINPHFIYNTLEIINMEAINGNTESASAMIQTFASYLRYSLNKGKDITTLSDEIHQIHSYMKIMNQRLNKRISFSVSCPAELSETKIPKLILQPLIENSIKHGFSNMNDYAVLSPEIRIDISANKGELEIRVIDNGRGIDSECFESSLNKKSDSVGLYNINRRLELFFGGKSSITEESIPYYMNTVSIHIIQELS